MIVVVKDGTNVQVSTTQVVSQQQEGSTVVETPAPVVIDQAANTALTTDDQVENGNDQNEQEGEGLSSIAFKPEEGLERQASFKALNTASGDVMEALVYVSRFYDNQNNTEKLTSFLLLKNNRFRSFVHRELMVLERLHLKVAEWSSMPSWVWSGVIDEQSCHVWATYRLYLVECLK